MTAGVRCHQCNAPIDGTALFCPRCGVDVSGEHPPESAGYGTRREPTRLQATMRQTLRDETLGEYEILAELGRGGMSTVFLAHEIALDRRVAIKVMAPHLLEGEGMVERFKLEARTAANLSHPHIVPIYAVRETEATVFFVMKFIEGRGLNSIIKKLGPLPIPMVKDILTKVGGALGYAHRHNVVHRDVKPSNIMIDEEGTPIVTDFGIAKVAEADELTVTGTAIGTPSYMSPEQCDGHPVTGASDQYSLGILAFEMLTGKLPFVGESPVSLMYKHCHEDPPPLEDFRPDCPPVVVETVMRMLAKDPADRWPSLEAAVQKLGTRGLGYFDPVRTQLMELVKEGGYRELLAQIQTPESPVPQVRSGRTSAGKGQATTRRGRRWAVGAAAALVLATAGVVAVGQPWQAAVATPAEGSPDDGAAAPAIRTDVPAATPGETDGAPPVTDGAAAAAADAAPSTGSTEEPSDGEVSQPPARQDPASATPIEPPAPAAVGSVRLAAAPDALAAGESMQMAATPFDETNAALEDRQTRWTSSDPAVARVEADGRVVAVAPGTAVITASVEGRTARHALTVTEVPVASVIVTPTALALDPGASQTITAEPRAPDGRTLEGRPVEWVSSDASVARVDGSGEVTAVGAGEATVTATVGSESGSVRVTVAPDTRVTLEGIVAAYAAALESGDIGRIRAVYPGLTGEQEDDLEAALGGMRNLEATLSLGDLVEDGSRATAQVSGTYRFVNRSNGRSEVVPITFTALFERQGSGWVLVETR